MSRVKEHWLMTIAGAIALRLESSLGQEVVGLSESGICSLDNLNTTAGVWGLHKT